MTNSETLEETGAGDSGRQFLVPAALIASAFNMSEARVRALMQRKLFRSRVEKGVDADAGSWRLTLRCGNRAWQGILTEDGTVRQQSVGLVPSDRRVT